MQGRLCCLRMQIMLLHCIVSRQKWPEVHIFVHKQKKRGYSACHGLRTPCEASFHWNPELFGSDKQIRQINSGAFGLFSAKLSVPIYVQWVLVFHYSTLISTKNQIQNIYSGFEFWPQRIGDLAFLCPLSVVHATHH